jgi:hypothetical protein
MVALGVELGLDRVEQITIEDGWRLPGQDLAFEDDFPDVEPVAQKMGERAAGEWDASDRTPVLRDRGATRSWCSMCRCPRQPSNNWPRSAPRLVPCEHLRLPPVHPQSGPVRGRGRGRGGRL